ncbi:MAG: MAPEG family protein [Xanthobacteraceae bacterium]
MSVAEVLLPVFVHVLLVFVLLFWMGKERRGALVSREVHLRDIALGEPNWPTKATQLANCLKNQFEFPVLFYVLVALALPLRQADLLFVLLSWVFVVTRYAHAGIFVTSNNVKQRSLAFSAGVIVLLVMWIVFALKILSVL